MYCNTDYIAVGFDALRSTIGRIAMWDFSEYALMVTNCIWPKDLSKDWRKNQT